MLHKGGKSLTIIAKEEYIDDHTVILDFIHQRILGISYMLYSLVNVESDQV